MAITTAEAFLAVLEKSKLLTTEQFAEAQDATLLTSDAAELSEMLIRQEMITSWQATQLLAGRSSFFLGNYSLMNLLGRGGMGSVFLAKHKTMNRRVALKVVSRRVGKDPASLERFLTEARSIAALDHPNIVRAYDVDQESDRFYIVMEYIEGQDLEAIVREHGLLGYEEVADCIRQAADGLAHAHGRNIIHCDIKPSNLLLSDQGTIKILDMGMARLAGNDEDSSEQHEPKVLGTVDYMSPEQAMGGPYFDQRSDIYSLGCTLYFLLTGRPPFDEGTLTQRIVKHQTQGPPDILAIRPDAPRQLADICAKMMAKSPGDRYQTAEEVSRLLAGWHEPSPANIDTADNETAKTEPTRKAQGQDLASGQQASGQQAAGQQAASPAMDELPDTGGPVAGPALISKQKKSWSEEQQTVMLVAAAVFVAIVVLSVALAAVALRTKPDNSPNTPIVRSNQQTPPDTTPTTDTPAEPPDKPPVDDQPPVAKPPVAKPPVAKPPVAKPPVVKRTVVKRTVVKRTVVKRTVVKQPVVKPPAPPAPIDPFGDLPPAIDLQLLPATVRRQTSPAPPPFMLASIHLATGSVLKTTLVGGDSALPGNGRFVLLPIEGDKDKQTWLVTFDHGKEEKGVGEASSKKRPANVARIWHGRDTLVFRWLEDVVAETANHLKNCALDITIDGKTRTLALSKPLSLEPLTIDLVGSTASVALTSKYLPDSSDLRLVITALEIPVPGGPVPGGRIKQARVVKANEYTDMEVSIGKQNQVVVRVYYSLTGGRTEVVVVCFCKFSGQKRLIRLKDSEWAKLEQQMLRLAATKQKLEADIAKQKWHSAVLTRKQHQLAAVQKRLDEAAVILKFKEAVHDNGKIHFREYIETDGRRIALTNTDALPAKKQEGR